MGCDPPGGDPSDASDVVDVSDATTEIDVVEGIDARVDRPVVDGTVDASVDGMASDAGSDARETSSSDCVPGCHWDCFGGTSCSGGTLLTLANAPRPCCRPEDFDLLSACVVRRSECAAPSCNPDTRYRTCLDSTARAVVSPIPGFDPLADQRNRRLLCGEGAPRSPGDACHADEDCRPIAEGAGAALRCDTSTMRCALTARPAAPDLYGQHCGVTSGADGVAPGATCAWCVISSASSGCLAQACTMPCDYDEDCPEGSMCLCASRPWGGRSQLGVCMRTSTRAYSASLAWLRCGASTSDAGVVDAGAPRCAAQRACATSGCADPAVLGIVWDGHACVALQGCRCEGADCLRIHHTSQACRAAHSSCGAVSEPTDAGVGCPATPCPAGLQCLSVGESMGFIGPPNECLAVAAMCAGS